MFDYASISYGVDDPILFPEQDPNFFIDLNIIHLFPSLVSDISKETLPGVCAPHCSCSVCWGSSYQGSIHVRHAHVPDSIPVPLVLAHEIARHGRSFEARNYFACLCFQLVSRLGKIFLCKRLDNKEFVEKQVASLNGNKKKSKGTPSAPLLPL